MESINALVVEDDPSLNECYVRLLKTLDMNVDSAGDYPSAAKLIKGNLGNYGFLLCDTSLGNPDGNRFGVDVAVDFREHNPRGVILGVSLLESMGQYWDGKCDEFLVKGKVNQQSVQRMIQQYSSK